MTLDLQILVPDGVILQARIVSLRAADASGQFGLHIGHEAFLTLLSPCVLSICQEDGRARFAAADGGVLLAEKGKVLVVTREAVTADRIEDVADAASAMLASRRQHERAAEEEFAELQSSLLRELRKTEVRK